MPFPSSVIVTAMVAPSSTSVSATCFAPASMEFCAVSAMTSANVACMVPLLYFLFTPSP